ncbi:hypothetical protein G6F70_004054 [Rhizopus microsporus]|uniref:Methionine aminopeptidase n=2 Tax=Rhizopus TaxID=4842 RepID=A0A367K4G2_RHIAZ|nr:hypothetical protein G6F71_004078 [Rhizopus microsporus]RCH97025.1 Methionine aminopeptidase 1D, chloroplastic/mitochondrial [Rhizopus azygosporus]KAG1200442.1 hypothetical protein G6F70_004054 [Rhizopus microsporus]KAG1214024.1 hypothetical protein G6F69_002315 [Rhizopus microsporus]KAG1230778.1 hypothetical protein G6F67_006226 [Rhizopus microsporus]
MNSLRRIPIAQVRSFHTTYTCNSPRGLTKVANRWGSFQRLGPSSLASIDVRQMKRRQVPDHILLPPYAKLGTSSTWSSGIPVNTEIDISHMRKAGKLAKEILEMGSTLCKPGVTTDSIDKALHEAIIENNAYPSPLNYNGFPKSVCTSINNVIAHGIPDDRELRDGDIINVDVTVYLNGYHGDTSATFLVGKDVDEQGKALVECTRECLDMAIKACGPKVPYKEIGRIISDHAAKHGYSVSDELSGHGIGKEFHCYPLILHHVNEEEGLMTPGTIFTIEPMLCQGSASGIMWPDQWTISTIDGGRSAQFEHTILITEDGVEVLTA